MSLDTNEMIHHLEKHKDVLTKSEMKGAKAAIEKCDSNTFAEILLGALERKEKELEKKLKATQKKMGE